MTCAEATDRILDHVYGELAEGERATFEAHLATCEGCRRELEGMERTRRTARLALDGPLSQPAPERIRREVLLAAELAVRQRGAVPAAAAAGAAQILGSGAGKGRASEAGSGAGSWWAWLRRPWFLPAFATVSLLAIFFIARPALMDGPRQALEDRFADEAAAPTVAPEPSAPAGAPSEPESAPPAAAVAELDQGRDEAADEGAMSARGGGSKGASLRAARPEAKERVANVADRERSGELARRRSGESLREDVLPRPATAAAGGARARIIAGAGNAPKDDGLARPARRRVEGLRVEGIAARDLAPGASTGSSRFAQPPRQLAVQPPPPPRLLVAPRKMELQEPMAASAPAPEPAEEEAAASAAGAGSRFESRAKKLAAPKPSADLALGLESRASSESAPPAAPAPRAQAWAGAAADGRSAGPPSARAPAAPAAAPAKAAAPRARAPMEADAPMASAPPQPPAEAIARDRAALFVLLERADRAFAEARWQAAADDYRELLRRFASDSRAREWTRRRDISLANLRRPR